MVQYKSSLWTKVKTSPYLGIQEFIAGMTEMLTVYLKNISLNNNNNNLVWIVLHILSRYV